MIIEQRYTIGTANHVFTHRSDLAFTEMEDTRGYGYPEDMVMVVKGYDSRNEWAEITYAGRVYNRYDGTREEYLGTGETFEAMLKLALGKPAKSGAWYGVKGRGRRYSPKFFD
jgi:hypothetical protein